MTIYLFHRQIERSVLDKILLIRYKHKIKVKFYHTLQTLC